MKIISKITIIFTLVIIIFLTYFSLVGIETDQFNNQIKSKLISLLTIYKPQIISSNQLYIINEEFRNLGLLKKRNSVITDQEAIKLYKDGLKIYNGNYKYVSFSRILEGFQNNF